MLRFNFRFFSSLFAACALGAASSTVYVGATESRPAKVTSTTIGGTGGWDYLAFEPERRVLYVTRGDRVQVIDARSLGLKSEIAGTAGVHGVAFDTLHRRGYTSNGKSNSVTVFDLYTYARLGEITGTGDGPDAIVYDPARRELLTFNGRSHDATVIDTVAQRVVGTVALSGKPEFAVQDGHGAVFVNNEDKATLMRIDTASRRVTAEWSLPGCESPTGLALDGVHGRLFTVCENRKMFVVDAASGAIVDTVPIGDGPDAVAYDAEQGLALVSNGEGSVTAVARGRDGRYAVTATIPTRRGARTLTLDPARHTAYLVTADFQPAVEPTPAETAASKPTVARRPVQVPGTFSVLTLDYAELHRGARTH